jgi:gamma-glutamyltranspeptidase / glutathione hydrolase
MKMHSKFALARLLAWLLVFATLPARSQSAIGRHGAVATVNGIASQAGIDAMKRGGNAVDAAVAAALTLGVVNGYNSGIGGGCFILIRRSNGQFLCIDGRETAPLAARRDMFVRDGKAVAGLSQTGALASGTPGALAAYDLALKSAGRLSLKDHLLAAARRAEEGFRVDRPYALTLREAAPDLAKFPASAAVFLKPGGAAYSQNEILRQPDLAGTYRAIAENGLDWFYAGPFAQAVAKWMRENQGLLTAEDFQSYRAVLRQAIATDYRNYTVVSFPPPSSGGVLLLEILNMLETRRFADRNFTPFDRAHFIIESMKLAFADRASWLGDPAFTSVPRGLIRKEYARALAAKIDLTHAAAEITRGAPPDAATDVFPKHTTHVSTADAEGSWVALTATINTQFGSKVVIPGTGVVMNNEMDDFSAQAGAPNSFGLVGAEANEIAPGKRPLSSMAPTIVLKTRRPILAIGAAGGPTIISQTLLNIVNILDLGMDAQSAIDQPKYHDQWKPDEVLTEPGLAPALLLDLTERGHHLRKVSVLGAAQAVGLAPDGKSFLGAADKRAGGVALAW